jgi:hypothetical protein
MAFMKISKELRATARSLHVSFASWERAMEDQDELQEWNAFQDHPGGVGKFEFCRRSEMSEL